jgi:hypothetical protein
MKSNQLRPDRIDLLIGCLFALLVMTIAVQGITPYHSWGDDFAGYLLQALSIENGSLEKEVLFNHSLLLETPLPIGPDAYPWGLPILIWIFSKIVGFDIHRLKIIEILALGLTGFFIFHLARFYLSRSLSLLASALVALQPSLIGSADSLISDIPFLALCASSIYFIELFHRRAAIEGKPSPYFAFLISALCLIAFSIRSNGAFLVPTYLGSSGWMLWKLPYTRRGLLRCGIMFICFFAVLLFLYFVIFPDGSLVQTNYLTANPSSLIRRLKETFYAFRGFIPFYPFKGLALFVITIFISISVMVGAWTNRTFSAGLIVFSILNLGLLLAYRLDAGTRYLFPLLIPISVLFISGFSYMLKKVVVNYFQLGHFAMRLIPLVAVLFLGVMSVGSWVYSTRPNDYEDFGPYGSAMKEIAIYTRKQIPENAKIAFFKPRAFRLLTGRPSVIVNEPNQIDRISYLVFNKKISDSIAQLPREYFDDSGRDSFISIFENEQFIIFRRHS